MEAMKLLEVIFDGKPFEDTEHLNSLYRAFQEQALNTMDGPDILESEIPFGMEHLTRVKDMRNSFKWISIPSHYYKRFQKSAEISDSFRERANKFLYSTESDEEEIHSKVLRAYNLAIAFAPNNSLELALAHEKRADLFLRLEKPDLAQEDINFTAAITAYPMKSAQKLIELQNRCTVMSLSLAKKRQQGTLPYSQYTNPTEMGRRYTEKNFYKLNSKHQSISNVRDFVDIEYQPHCGRKIIVNQQVKAGEVLMIDEPFAIILEKILKWDMEHCTNCSKPILGGIPCQSCTFGWYCSKSCHEEASRGVHKYEHKYLSYLKSSSMLSLKGLLAARILFKVGPEELYRIYQSKDPLYFPTEIDDPKYRGFDGLTNIENHGTYLSTSYLPIYHLISHPHFNILKSKSNTFKALLMTHLIEDSSDFFFRYKYNEDFEEFRDFIASLLLRHMESIDYNAITLSQVGLKGQGPLRYGAGVYPVLCLVNHSCDPNCVPVRSLRFLKTAVVAMKTLQPGDEVTFSYAPYFALMEPADRRKFLFERYNFKCMCEPCLAQWGPDNCKSYYVPECQCNSCARYPLIGQCPKCSNKDVELKNNLVALRERVPVLYQLIEDKEFIKAMEVVKSCLSYCSENFAINFALTLELQEIFKLVLVGLVTL